MADLPLPSQNADVNGSLTGLLQTFIGGELMQLDKLLPCKVVEVDRNKNRVTVKPTISRLTTAGEPVERAEIVDVPIINLSCGFWIFNFPTKVGDRGWIVASDRDLSLYKQSYEPTKPNTTRRHTFEDALFIPDHTKPEDWELPAEGVVLQSHDQKTKIHLEDQKVTIWVDKDENTKIEMTPKDTYIQNTPTCWARFTDDNIHIQPNDNNFIQMNADNIHIQTSGDNFIQMDGAHIGIQATGGNSIDMNGAEMNIKCATINIEGTVNVKGATDIVGAFSTTGSSTNNGVNIGSTHVHSQGSDSHGDGEVDTDPPH